MYQTLTPQKAEALIICCISSCYLWISISSLMMIDDLINEVSLKYPEAKAIFSLLMKDPQISNALKQVNLNRGKSQAYDYVKKMQSYAKELYNKNYR